MAVGWAGDNAVQDQIQDSIADEVRRARANLPRGESRAFCEECGEPIPEARRRALPGVRLCLDCQQEADREQHAVSLYNRKGSKDSQLR
ncbi:DksA/TraR family C4-type zinc finger protein [uncultured Desulfovibrio sp.]|uniref:DksA/TraR family C4-type zinc finger protein n=1 Tax=uncultured Desulfovibrio sp. TaxID=167968 RepID=UPI002612DE62|nr:DksA/TraR family C4-type zinc finger protein [uncultured Desulfovibrio sp.]